MYVALWHALPGPKIVKFLQILLLLAIAILLLFQWAFPWVTEYFNLTGNTVS